MDRDRDDDENAETSPNPFENMDDHLLDDKIKRTRKLLGVQSLSRFADNGKKLKIHLHKLLKERERRMQSKMSKAESSMAAIGERFEKFERASVNLDYPAKEFEGKTEYSTPPRNKFARIGSHSSVTYSLRSRIDDCFSWEEGFPQRQNKMSTSFRSSYPLGQVNPCRHFAGNESLSLTKQGQAKKKDAKLIVLDKDDDKEPMQPHLDKISERWTKDMKIYYPTRDDSDSVEISYFDMKCLKPFSYLSSQIMNFYIRYLQRPQSLTSQQRNTYHFFNTYFYNKLDESLSDKRQQKNCDSLVKLRRWLKGVNIFEKAYVFLPIHHCLHWSLAIICFPAKEEKSGPLVLHLDSLGLHSSSIIFQNVGSFLKMEWEHFNRTGLQNHIPVEESIWKTLTTKIVNIEIEVPQQDNNYDCGLFVLFFIERFLKDAPERIRKNDLHMFGRKWFRPVEASCLRNSIKGLLEKQFDLETSR